MDRNSISNDEILENHYKKMSETPVDKLILSLCVPTVISMLITMIYNVADTFFVSKISVSASGATGILFSLMAILQAFGFMFGQGAGSNLSRKLGAKDLKSAREYASTGFFLALFMGVIISIFGLAFLKEFMTFLGSTDTILPYSMDYGKFILIAAPAFTTSCVMNNILRYEGLTKFAMIGLISGGIINTVLDPIFIFTLKMGILGAGLSTAVSQYISMFTLYMMLYVGHAQSKLSIKYIRIDFKMVINIIKVGFPSLTRQGFNSLSALVLNVFSQPYGDACIAAMSIVSKCAGVIYSVCVGIGQGFQPVSSFNYGARKFSRVREGILFTWRFSTIVVSIMSVICFLMAPEVVKLFRKDMEVLNVGIDALRYMCIALFFLPTSTIANMTFQSIGKSAKATFLACMQNGLLFIPSIVVLHQKFGVFGVEISKPVAFVVSAFIAMPILLSFINSLSESYARN